MSRRTWIIFAGVLALLGVIGLVAGREPVPSFQGRSAEVWLSGMAQQNHGQIQPAKAAFTAMGERAIPQLKRALLRRDSLLKRAAIWLDARNSWINVDWCRDSAWRRAAVQATVSLGPRGTPLLPELITAFVDRDVPVAPSHFVDAFVAIGSPAIPALAQGLGSIPGRSEVESATLEAWAEIVRHRQVSVSLLPLMLQFLSSRLAAIDESSPANSVAAHAATVAGLLGARAEPLVDELLPLLQRADHPAKIAAIDAMGAICTRPSVVVPCLTDVAHDNDWRVRLSAAKALGRYGPQAADAVPALARMAEDPKASVAVAALNALRRVGPAARPATAHIISGLRSPYPLVRLSAAVALRKVAPAAALVLGPLVQSLQDELPEVRAAAAESLGHLGPAGEPAVEALMQALKSNPERVQVSVVEALGNIGPAALPAVPSLRAAGNNNQSALGQLVVAALTRIEAPARVQRAER